MKPSSRSITLLFVPIHAKSRYGLRCLGVLSAMVLTVAMHGRIAAAGPVKAPNLLRVHVIGLRNDHGNVRCSLFTSTEGFPGDGERAITVIAPIVDRIATCEFARIPPGAYAVVLFHDENADGKFNRNWIGLPQEGYGFSNDARAYLHPPSFTDASFSFAGGTLDTRVDIHY
jgi:uncharacterized protein (DUF2141 family)